MENSYRDAFSQFFDNKNNGNSPAGATTVLSTASGAGTTLPLATDLLQQAAGFAAALREPQNIASASSLQDVATNAGSPFSFLQNGEEPMHSANCSASGLLGSIPDFEMTEPALAQATSAQVPQKKILFEACTTNQPLQASLRKWSTGSYYFLK